MEQAFEQLLETLCPSEDLFQMAVHMLREVWDRKEKNIGQEVLLIKKDYAMNEKKIEQLMDRIIETDSPALVKAYEERLKSLELCKVGLDNQRNKMERPHQGFDQTFRTPLEFFRNPQKLWFSDHVVDKKLVLKLVFAKPLEYSKKSGFRTALTSCPFRLFSGFEGGGKVWWTQSGSNR